MSYPVGRFFIAVTLGVAAYAPRVQALQLVWHAPAECPTADVILRETRRLAGANQGEALEALAVVTQTPDQRWRVVIELSGSATGHRTLTADNCRQLARACSLIIALAANPDAALDLVGDEPSNNIRPVQPDNRPSTPAPSIQPPDNSRAPMAESAVSPSSPTPNSQLIGETDMTTPPKQQASVAVEMLSRAGLEWGSLPTSTGWLGLGMRVRSSATSVSLALTTHMTQGTSATFANGVGASFRVFAAQTRLCAESSANRWYLSGCGGMQLALLRASGDVRGEDLGAYGFAGAVTFTRYRWIPGPLLSVSPRYEFAPRVTAEAGVDLVIPTTHWQFVIENMAPLFRPANVQYLLYLGLSYRLN